MTPRRRETGESYNQPVRFYKAVALTFLCFTVVLFGIIVFMSTKRATITIETKITPVDVTGRIEIGGEERVFSESTVSSTAVSVSEVFSPATGREEESVATGFVTLQNDTASAQALVPTTRLLSPEGALFRLKGRAEIPAKGTVVAEVYADQKGTDAHIGPTRFTIPGLSEEKQKVIYGVSSASMSGGTRTVGVFGVDDKKSAEERIVALLLEEGKKRIGAMEDSQGVTVQLLQHAIEFDTELDTEASEITATGRGTVVAISYPREELKQYASAILEKRAVDEREAIEPRTEDPTVTVEEYDPTRGTAVVKVFYSGLAALNPESGAIEKSVFFGKSKEEIRRYLLALDHVHGVSVDFTPAWVGRVPYSADHVQVIVKHIE